MEKEKTKQKYSHHIFLLPFIIENEDFNIKHLDSKIFSNWEKFEFKVNTPRDYSERVYFYDYVYDTIFFHDEKSVLRQYEYKKPNDDFYFYLTIRDEKYSLKIEDIILNIYESGVGILSLHMTNYDISKIEDIKKINEYARRIYPQFLSKDGKKFTEIPKNKFLSTEIEISGIKDTKSDFGNFDDFNHFKFPFLINSKSNSRDFLPPYLMKLIDEFDYLNISPIIDDRMFVISWIGNNNLSAELSKCNVWRFSEDWHNLIFCDGVQNSNQANNELRNELNEKHTLKRWSDYGTFYGISRYSFIVLTDESDFAADTILGHVMTMYFQMVQLVLVQRTSLLKFSKEATELSGLIDGNMNKNHLEKLKKLQIGLIRFTNRIYHREITAQEQGIEIYNKLQDMMMIEKNIDGLDKEVYELNRYAEFVNQNNISKESGKHTIIATIFLPALLLSGLLALKLSQDQNAFKWIFNFDMLQQYWVPVIIVILLIFILIKWDCLKKKNLHVPLLTFIFWITLLLVFYFWH